MQFSLQFNVEFYVFFNVPSFICSLMYRDLLFNAAPPPGASAAEYSQMYKTLQRSVMYLIAVQFETDISCFIILLFHAAAEYSQMYKTLHPVAVAVSCCSSCCCCC